MEKNILANIINHIQLYLSELLFETSPISRKLRVVCIYNYLK